MITLNQAKQLTHGTILYHVSQRNADKSPARWRVNGNVKTWKRQPERLQIPVKYGLYGYDYLTENDLHLVCLTAEEALNG